MEVKEEQAEKWTDERRTRGHATTCTAHHEEREEGRGNMHRESKQS